MMSPGICVQVVVNVSLHVFEWQPFKLIRSSLPVRFAVIQNASARVQFLGNLYE